MTQQLRKGENISLANFKEIIVAIKWIKKNDNKIDFKINPSVFMLNENNKISQKEDFIFHTQPISAHNGIILKNQMFKVTLNKIQQSIVNIPFILAFDELCHQQSFKSFKIVIKVFNFSDKKELFSYTLDDATIETALIVGSLYRHQQEWKFKAIGQGYKNGLKALAKNFGVNIVVNTAKLQNKHLLNNIKLTVLNEKIIRSSTKEAIFEYGKAYYQHDKVIQFNYDDSNHTITAQVSDNKGSIYNLTISEQHNGLQINSSCNCNDYPCGHSIAVLLTYLHYQEQNNSIEEATEKEQEINYGAIPNNDKNNVPYWQHRYVYSYSEINNASIEQVDFYHYFKKCLLDDKYIDLENNLNYAFVLLFDLLKEYNHHQNLDKLEMQLNILGKYYEKTKSYCVRELKRIKNGGENNYDAEQYYYNRLGDHYKDTLNLNTNEIEILNKLNYNKNTFSTVEYCFVELIKLFLKTINELKVSYLKEGSSLEQELSCILDIIARKEFRYRKNSRNYKGLLSMFHIVHLIIFKHCENGLRECYEHARKINVDFYKNKEINEELNKLLVKVNDIISIKIETVNAPDLDAEVKLNLCNKTRWKSKFKKITDNFKPSTEQLFIEDTKKIAELNKNNPVIKNLFFNAFKFIKTSSKESALIMYCYYIQHHYDTSTTPHKSITKSEQKLLFTSQQQQAFDVIIIELINTKNISHALEKISLIYVVNRKRIQFDRAAIEHANEQYDSTVTLLNIYLQDDESTITDNSNEQNVKSISLSNEINIQSISINTIGLNTDQLEILRIFPMNNYSVSQVEIEKIAKEKSLFKNQLIDSINEICYEHLDDVLIEEDDDECYIINENYYQRIIEVC